MASQKKTIILQRQRSNHTLNPLPDEKATLAKLHNVFEARIKSPLPNNKTSSSSTAESFSTSGAASTRHIPITSPRNKVTPPRTSNLLSSSSSSPTASRLLNDPLLKLGKASAAASSNIVKSSTPTNVSSTPINVKVANSDTKKQRVCHLCKMKVPLVKQAFIDHIMGKKHRLAEYKQKLTKEQKEEKDGRTLHVRGFDNRTLPEEICGRFWEYGMIDFQASQKHVFIIFATKKEATTALASKVYTSNGKRLFVALRSPRNHVSDKDAEKPVEFFLSPLVKNLIAVVPRSDDQLQECLERLLNDVQLRPEEYNNRQAVRECVERFLRLEFPNVACHVFGSSANNLGFREADIDLYAALGYDPYDTPRAGEGEAAAAKLTYYLAKHLKRQNWASNVSAIPKARVPIVKFQQNGIAVDLSFRNAMPIQNTALIRLYTFVHPLVRPYMMVVRFWAKMQRLAGGGKPDTLLTNYALTMLMAFVTMVDRNMLPPLAALRRQPYRQIIINGWNCGFGEDTSAYTNRTHDCSVLQLVLEFFEYYASLKAEEWVICPLVGQLISRKDMGSKSLSRLPSDLADYTKSLGNLQHETPLCVQDPFDLTHNVTRGLRKIPLERFQLLCKKSAEILKKILRLQLPLVALFQPIEVTDDMFDQVGTSSVDGRRQTAVNKINQSDMSLDVIDIDDDEANKSQEIEFIEEVRNIFQVYENGVSKTNGASPNEASKGIKRSSDTAPVITGPTNQSAAQCCCLTSAEQQLCTNIEPDSPFIYRLTIPTDCDLDPTNGNLTTIKEQKSDEENLKLGLNILEFMLAEVYAADVMRTDITDESAAKKSKSSEDCNSSSGSSRCIAKLTTTFKYEVREGKVTLRMINSSLAGQSVSPFTSEQKLKQLQLDDISKGSTKYCTTREPFYATFYVCVASEQSKELVLLANTINRSKIDKDFLTRFLSSFRLLTNSCLKKIPPHLLWMKRKVKPGNQV